VKIHFGALCAPLTEQLKGYVASNPLDLLERDNQAITRLIVRGYLTDSQGHAARKKLMRAIEAAVEEGA
jgi:hypothetical protein